MNKKLILIVLIIIVVIAVVGIVLYNNTIHNNEENNINEDSVEIDIISTFNSPIVPEGFKKLETETASWELENGIPKGWDKGLVIEDEIGNQFVWVPVINLDWGDLQKEVNNLEVEGVRDEESEEERKQIERYGGFYIARYEAGISEKMQTNIEDISAITNDIKGIPVSKKGIIVWDYISLKNAKINAKSMYSNENIQSDLVTTRQWLYIMKWLSETGYDIENPKDFGNFVDSHFKFTGYYSIDYGESYKYGENITKQTYNMILSAGATERNMTNNIYDLAGNLMEYTDGYVLGRGYYSIGGHYDTTSNYVISAARLIGVVPLEKLGFRVVLYFK